ncbi:DUF3144 domain-containing protein [Asticcacaulis sp. 201]|uniref:DUF3144 domain-containing protein n=1 Tax=Asticcacaulis sp. 201 TaxID=3028787 RepID=UPI002915E725|nr:DUF3144 domain-containing protein [Asticcacaulis sp. 201]MDV6332373.1 DUF3144 domain-containing protein [Asticcacaulis sp. 201]
MASQEELDFTGRAKAHIDLCNAQSAHAHSEDVALSAMYAAARYTAFLCLGANTSGEQMAGRREEALAIFDDQFRQMFLDCYDEFARDFDRSK